MGKAFLSEAIESILGQTFMTSNSSLSTTIYRQNGEDTCRLREPGQTNARPAPRKQGTAVSLNIGINLALGGYIARMDADDVALPHRLEEQVDFMERHPEVGLLVGQLK